MHGDYADDTNMTRVSSRYEQMAREAEDDCKAEDELLGDQDGKATDVTCDEHGWDFEGPCAYCGEAEKGEGEGPPPEHMADAFLYGLDWGSGEVVAYHMPTARFSHNAARLPLFYREVDRAKYISGRAMAEADMINELADQVHDANKKWWRDPQTGEPIERNKGEMLALIISEISECLEGERKNCMDDHLPHRKMAEVELADALIRIFDYAAGHGYDLGGAFVEKMEYNRTRKDHTNEARSMPGGKKF